MKIKYLYKTFKKWNFYLNKERIRKTIKEDRYVHSKYRENWTIFMMSGKVVLTSGKTVYNALVQRPWHEDAFALHDVLTYPSVNSRADSA
jgi:hypothetical protein